MEFFRDFFRSSLPHYWIRAHPSCISRLSEWHKQKHHVPAHPYHASGTIEWHIHCGCHHTPLEAFSSIISPLVDAVGKLLESHLSYNRITRPYHTIEFVECIPIAATVLDTTLPSYISGPVAWRYHNSCSTTHLSIKVDLSRSTTTTSEHLHTSHMAVDPSQDNSRPLSTGTPLFFQYSLQREFSQLFGSVIYPLAHFASLKSR